MIDVDVDVIRQAVQDATDVFDAYRRYRELGGKLELGEFVNTLVLYGVFVRRGCP